MSHFLKRVKENSEIIQAVSAAVVAIFAVFTFFSWQTSVALLSEEKKNDLIENRAYVSVNDAQLRQNSGTYTGWFSIVNEGRTPAYQLSLQDYYSSNHVKETIGSAVNSSAGYLGPNQSLKF